MALIKCKECDNEISDKAKSCPQCGVSIASKKGFITNVANGVLMTILVFLIFLITTSILTIFTNPKTDGDKTLIFLFGLIISIFSPYLYKKYKAYKENKPEKIESETPINTDKAKSKNNNKRFGEIFFGIILIVVLGIVYSPNPTTNNIPIETNKPNPIKEIKINSNIDLNTIIGKI